MKIKTKAEWLEEIEPHLCEEGYDMVIGAISDMLDKVMEDVPCGEIPIASEGFVEWDNGYNKHVKDIKDHIDKFLGRVEVEVEEEERCSCGVCYTCHQQRFGR